MRIKRIELKNFQAHQELAIDLGRITSIQGPTDKGKSAILRALRWALLNDFAGDEFIRDGAKNCSVTVTISERKQVHVIQRSRGSAGNLYLLDEEELRAFGQGVPQIVSDLLRVNEINFQSQHDAPFWFCESAGEVSRQLNRVIDLSVIDTSLSAIGNEVRKSQDRVTLTEERLETAKIDLEQWDAQKERVGEFDQLKAKADRDLEIQSEYDKLESILTRISQNKAKELVEKADDLETVYAWMRKAVKVSRSTKQLEELIGEITELEEKAFPPPMFDAIEKAFEKAKNVKARAAKLTVLIHRIEEQYLTTNALASAFEWKENQFHEQIKGETCPTCNQIIKL